MTIPPPFPGRNQRIAYVEFGDEEAMKAGLEKHAEVLDDSFRSHLPAHLTCLVIETQGYDT